MEALELNARVQALLGEPTQGQLYLFDYGFVYAGTWGHEESTTRFAATIVFSLDDLVFQLTAAGQTGSETAVAFSPFVKRALSAPRSLIVSVGITPRHPFYRAFRDLGVEGMLRLNRADFAHLDKGFLQAAEGVLNGHDAQALCRAVCETFATKVPAPEPLDKRVEQVLELLDMRPNYPLEELSQVIGLSYDRLSHLFSEQMGLPLRSYALGQKIHRATQLTGRGMSFTEIAQAAGFADSAHFSRVWVKSFGASPSAFFGRSAMRVHNALTQFDQHLPLD